MTKHHIHRALVLAAALFVAPSAWVHAETAPAKTTRIVVGFAAGGTFDIAARLVAEQLKTSLGRTVIVETKAGAGGRVAMDWFKTLRGDGTVAMLCPDILSTIYPLVFSKLGYDPERDFLPASTLAEYPMALAVPATSGIRTLADYVQWARANPTAANFGHGATGGPTYFMGLMLGKAINVPMQDVPFQGAAPMVTSLVGGQINGGMAIVGDFVEYHKAGKLRVLAVSGRERSSQIPDVPTFQELGYAGLSGTGLISICLPPGTAPDVVAEWNTAIGAALQNDELKQRLATYSFKAMPSSPADALARHRELRAFWEPTVKASGYKAD